MALETQIRETIQLTDSAARTLIEFSADGSASVTVPYYSPQPSALFRRFWPYLEALARAGYVIDDP